MKSFIWLELDMSAIRNARFSEFLSSLIAVLPSISPSHIVNDCNKAIVHHDIMIIHSVSWSLWLQSVTRVSHLSLQCSKCWHSSKIMWAISVHYSEAPLQLPTKVKSQWELLYLLRPTEEGRQRERREGKTEKATCYLLPGLASHAGRSHRK